MYKKIIILISIIFMISIIPKITLAFNSNTTFNEKNNWNYNLSVGLVKSKKFNNSLKTSSLSLRTFFKDFQEERFGIDFIFSNYSSSSFDNKNYYKDKINLKDLEEEIAKSDINNLNIDYLVLALESNLLIDISKEVTFADKNYLYGGVGYFNIKEKVEIEYSVNKKDYIEKEIFNNNVWGLELGLENKFNISNNFKLSSKIGYKNFDKVKGTIFNFILLRNF